MSVVVASTRSETLVTFLDPIHCICQPSQPPRPTRDTLLTSVRQMSVFIAELPTIYSWITSTDRALPTCAPLERLIQHFNTHCFIQISYPGFVSKQSSVGKLLKCDPSNKAIVKVGCWAQLSNSIRVRWCVSYSPTHQELGKIFGLISATSGSV